MTQDNLLRGDTDGSELGFAISRKSSTDLTTGYVIQAFYQFSSFNVILVW